MSTAAGAGPAGLADIVSTVTIGLMSGTSLDGIDAVLVDFGADIASPRITLLGHAHTDLAEPLRTELLALNRSAGDEIHRGALAANAMARASARLVDELLAHAALERGSVTAIGCHGQTVRHRPGEFDGTGYTVQLNAPALLAELTGIDVVADFRGRDVAAGGQGAPLVPAFHVAAFGRRGSALAVLNLGGIANLTCVDPAGAVVGFDCGPANALLDAWCAAHTGRRFDAEGAWAATGHVDPRLLESLLAEPYFARPAPKSTGRDLFDSAWLDARLTRTAASAAIRPEDVQATLAELTARTTADAVRRYAPAARELVVCGGGAFNSDLMRRLARRLSSVSVLSSAAHGLPPDQVEACAFAWLAQAFLHRRPGNIVSVTGAAGPRILGALYPAS